jgi:transcriptional regulator with XRE-family HTH domain
MGKRALPKPKYLAAKLLAIRKTHELTQNQLADKIKVKAKRISEFELGRRTPNLILLLHYARLAEIPMEFLVIDEVDVAYFTQYVGAKYRGEVTIPITLYWHDLS